MTLFETLPRVAKPSIVSASYKVKPDDFRVTEELSFQPTGTGEHLFLLLEKRMANTHWVADRLAHSLGVHSRDIGTAGLKDRHAITQQWFSVYWPGKDKPEHIELPEGVMLKEITLNDRKLRKGAVERNHFILMLRDVVGDRQEIERHLVTIQQKGLPNYFGPQRFGHNGNNLIHAEHWLLGRRRYKRQQTSIYLSAIRSWFFNQWLAARIESGIWSSLSEGDTVNLNGTRSIFAIDHLDDELNKRLIEGDIHIAGPLPGGDFLPSETSNFETLKRYWQRFLPILEKLPKGTDYRAVRVFAQDMAWQWHDDDLELSFALPSGSYASALLFSLGSIEDHSQRGMPK